MNAPLPFIPCHLDDDAYLRFIPIPKNGSTSIISVMFKVYGAPETIHQLKPRQIPWQVDDAATFAVIRDPVTRFLSAWYNKVFRPHRPDTVMITRHGMIPGTPLADFVARVEEYGVGGLDRHIAPQRAFLPDYFSKHVHLLRFEDLRDEWRRAGLLNIYGRLETLNASLPVEDIGLTSDLVERIQALYPLDIELHRYVASGRYPLKASALGTLERM